MDNQALAGELDAVQALYARTLYSLRESRKAMLQPYAVADEAGLLEQIRRGDVAPHPAYEHYLGALIIGQARDEVRTELAERMRGAEAGDSVRLHAMLEERITRHYAHRLSAPVRCAQDALLLFFESGLVVEARYYSVDEYAIAWSWGEAELRIDTAPVHPDCATFPQHLHDDCGQLCADPLTRPGTPCWPNLSRLIDALLLDPLLLAVESPRPAVLLNSESTS